MAVLPPAWAGWRWPVDAAGVQRLRVLLNVGWGESLWAWVREHETWVRAQLGITNQLKVRGYRHCRYRKHHSGVCSQLLDAVSPQGDSVVVKVIHLADRQQRPWNVGAGFLEVALLAAGDAPVVASVEGWPFGRVGIVMPAALGDLAQRLKLGGLSPSLVTRWTASLQEQLWALHRRGVAHLDLKPENILVFAGDRLRVTDFGHSVLCRGQREYDTWKQTVWYRSPQLLEVMSRHQALAAYDPMATDVWALGMVLWDLVVTRPLLSRVCDREDSPACWAYLREHVREWRPVELLEHYTVRVGLTREWVLEYLEKIIGPLVQWRPEQRPAAVLRDAAAPDVTPPSEVVARLVPLTRYVAPHIEPVWLRGASVLWGRACSTDPLVLDAAVALSFQLLLPWYPSHTFYAWPEWPQPPQRLQEAQLRLAEQLHYDVLW